MSLLDKIKGLLNVDGVLAEITSVEKLSFAANSIKGMYRLQSGIDAKIIKMDFTLFVVLENGDTEEPIATFETQEHFAVKAGETLDGEFQLDNLNLLQKLEPFGIKDIASAAQHQAVFKMLMEIDVEEAAGLFDPQTLHIVELVA